MTFRTSCSLLALLGSFAAAQGNPAIHVRLKPVMLDGVVSAVAVETRFDTDGAPLAPLTVSETLGPLFHIADRIGPLAAQDDAGPLTLTMSSGLRKTDEATPLGANVRIWTPSRPTKGMVTIRYTAAVSHEMLPGPSWEVRSETRGVSAAGNTFLLLPDGDTKYHVTLNWDLSALPRGADAISSLSPDAAQNPITTEALRSTYFMAGRLQRLPETGGPFHAASTADTPYDQMMLLQWAGKVYGNMLTLFGPPQQHDFTVLLRGSQISRISGTELPGALMATFMKDTPLSEVQNLAAHEMVHVFMGGLDPESWYEEGLAVSYQSRALFMTGMIDSNAYIADVNQTARTYYSNLRSDMPMKEATASFWTDARARLQSYVRGGLYMDLVNAELKAKTGGKRNLDTVMHEFIAARNAGQPVTVDAWLKLLTRDLGPQVVADNTAMLAGKQLMLPSNAFGPCFTRVSEKMPAFELGFDMASLMQQPRVIKGLQAGSPAAKSGLNEGDVVVRATPLDTAQENAAEPMMVAIERDGNVIEFHFAPRGRMLTGYQWVRLPAIPEAGCRL